MKRTVIMVLIALILYSTFTTSGLSETYSINAIGQNSIYVTLDLSSGTAYVGITRLERNGFSYNTSITLQRKDGNNWVKVKTWYKVSNGAKYSISITPGIYRAVSTTLISQIGQDEIETVRKFTESKVY